MNEIRMIAFDMIQKERNRQDKMWGIQDHKPQYWVGILGEEYGELCQAVNETVLYNATKKEKGGIDNITTELCHVASVAIAAIECIIRNNSHIERGYYEE